MHDLKKNRDVNQVSWKPGAAPQFSLWKSRDRHTSKPQEDGHIFRYKKVTLIPASTLNTKYVSGHPHTGQQVPVPLLKWGCLGSLHPDSTTLHPCFSSSAVCSSPSEKYGGQGGHCHATGQPVSVTRPVCCSMDRLGVRCHSKQINLGQCAEFTPGLAKFLR